MSTQKVYRVIGLMSGTSLDGIDVALIETDGVSHVRPLDFLSIPYADEERAVLRGVLGRGAYDDDVRVAEDLLTDLHIRAVQEFGYDDVDLIGFHGQTLFHDPAQGSTFQIGDAAKMANVLGVDVVHDFRTQDVQSGGQGAPLLPLYHAARIQSLGRSEPVCVLNIGGVSNVTYIDGNGALLAFDCGPGNALIDDFVFKNCGKKYDKNGCLAKSGQINRAVLATFLAHDYFNAPAPKSLDRDMWNTRTVQGVGLQDGAATLTAFTVEAIKKASDILPFRVEDWFVCGGGRHNGFMMDSLRVALEAEVHPVEKIGWNGDAVEAEGFAYLAVRSVLGLPLSLPSTTGVSVAISGGVRHKAS